MVTIYSLDVLLFLFGTYLEVSIGESIKVKLIQNRMFVLNRLDDQHVQSHFSHIRLFSTPWMVTHQAPMSVEFSQQEYWSGLPFPSPGDLSDPGIKPRSPTLQADSLPLEPPGKPIYIISLSLSLSLYSIYI